MKANRSLHVGGHVFSIEENGKTDIHVFMNGKKSDYVIKQWGPTERWYVVIRTPLGDEMSLHHSVSNGQTIFGRTMTFKSTDKALFAASCDYMRKKKGE